MSVGEKIKYEGPGKKYKREVKRGIKNLLNCLKTASFCVINSTNLRWKCTIYILGDDISLIF